ncbi:UNVERIFIED_CONTAM: heme peroxidase [Siphonaria sp. JEL0065]|nr:heme peroxidase [Siphonaria sp. JEL0065]
MKPYLLFGLALLFAAGSLLFLAPSAVFQKHTTKGEQSTNKNTTAFVTYLAHEGEAELDNGYFLSTRLMIRTFKEQFNKTTIHPRPDMIVLVIPQTGPETRRIIESEGALVKEVDYDALTPPSSKGTLGRYHQMFGKLAVWNMTEYSQVVFIDGDILVQGDLRKILTARPPEAEIAAVNDYGEVYRLNRLPRYFNGGFMILKPSKYRFDDMVSMLKHEVELHFMAEQEWLNWYWGRSFHQLDPIFNMQFLVCENIELYEGMDRDTAILVHFKGPHQRSEGWTPFYVSTATPSDWNQLRNNIVQQVTLGNGPRLIRLALKNSLSFSVADGTGGPHGQFLLDPANSADLGFIQGLFDQVTPASISNSDALAFAAAVAVTNSNNHGVEVKFRPGRRDAVDQLDAAYPSADGVTNANWNATMLRSWAARIGFTSDKDVVALMGAHNLGNCAPQRSGYSGPWSTTPLTLTNEFFTLLVLSSSTPSLYTNQTIVYKDSTKWQWEDVRGRIMLPIDMNMIKDPSYFEIIKNYSTDETSFVKDFADVYGRLLEVGVAQGLGSPVDAKATVVKSSLSTIVNTQCYPTGSNPIICISSDAAPDGISTQYTVHSLKKGWAGIGVGSTSMENGDVIVGWNNGNGTSVQFLSTKQHSIQLNLNPVWRRVPLDAAVPTPPWAAVSFSAIHLNTVATDIGRSGNSIDGNIIFAVSSYPPDNNGVTAASFYQHEISGVLLNKNGTVPSLGTDSGISVGLIGGIAAGIVVLIAVIGAFVYRSKKPKATASEKPPHLQTIHSEVARDNSVFKPADTPRSPPELVSVAIPAPEKSLFRTMTQASAHSNQTTPTQDLKFVPSPTTSIPPPLPEFQDRVNDYLVGRTVLPQDPQSWSVIDVAAWVLMNGGNESGAKVVRDEGVTGRVLVASRVSDLVSLLGITRYGDRVLFEEAWIQLQNGQNHDPPLYLA